jgi:hypothetical protein
MGSPASKLMEFHIDSEPLLPKLNVGISCNWRKWGLCNFF